MIGIWPEEFLSKINLRMDIQKMIDSQNSSARADCHRKH